MGRSYFLECVGGGILVVALSCNEGVSIMSQVNRIDSDRSR